MTALIRQCDPSWRHLTENRSSQSGNRQLLVLRLLLQPPSAVIAIVSYDLFCARHQAQHFTYILSFSTENNTTKYVQTRHPMLGEEKWFAWGHTGRQWQTWTWPDSLNPQVGYEDAVDLLYRSWQITWPRRFNFCICKMGISRLAQRMLYSSFRLLLIILIMDNQYQLIINC